MYFVQKMHHDVMKRSFKCINTCEIDSSSNLRTQCQGDRKTLEIISFFLEKAQFRELLRSRALVNTMSHTSDSVNRFVFYLEMVAVRYGARRSNSSCKYRIVLPRYQIGSFPSTS